MPDPVPMILPWSCDRCGRSGEAAALSNTPILECRNLMVAQHRSPDCPYASRMRFGDWRRKHPLARSARQRKIDSTTVADPNGASGDLLSGEVDPKPPSW